MKPFIIVNFNLFPLKLFCLFAILTYDIHAQPSLSNCLEDFKKISPNASISPFPHEFGESIDILGNVAVVGIPQSDSLQLNSGLAKIFELIDGTWEETAVLYPSESFPNMAFGIHVKIKKNNIYISSQYTQPGIPGSSYAHGTKIDGNVYIYKKPINGWISTYENVKFTIKNSDNIGKSEFVVSNQENVIGWHSKSWLYFIVKEGTEWTASDTLVSYQHTQTTKSIINLSIDDDILAYTAGNYEGSDVFIKKANPSWTEFEDLQTITRNSSSTSYFGIESVLNKNHLLLSQVSLDDSIFLYSTNDKWETIEEEIILTSHNIAYNFWGSYNDKSLLLNDSLIVVGRVSSKGSGFLSVYHEPASGWVNAKEDRVIDLPEFSHSASKINYAISPLDQLIITGVASDFDNQNGNDLLFYNINSDPIVNTGHFQYEEINSAGINFGTNTELYGDILAVTSLDESRDVDGKQVVHLYRNTPENSWEYINTIESDSSIEYPIGFGASLAFDDNYLVVGAPLFQEHDSLPPSGCAFVYKRENDWTKVQKVAELRPSNYLEAANETIQDMKFGDNVAIQGNTIAVSAIGKDIGPANSRDKGMIYVFEKDEQQEWKSSFETAKLHSKHASEYAQIGGSFVLTKKCIISSHYWSPDAGSALISVFVKPENGWKDTTETYLHEIDDIGYGSFKSGHMVLNNDLLFIGAPSYIISKENIFGRIYIFKKSGEDWSDIKYVNKINYNHKNYYNYPVEPVGIGQKAFGYTFDVVDNILVSGIDFKLGRYGTWNERKGIAPVFQALDASWENVIQLTELHGDNYTTVDRFGIKVTANRDDILICAPADNSETGYNSGTVYHFSMAPTIKLVEPICADIEPIILEAYPDDGIWSGEGIKDDMENTFYPEIAGPGEHQLTYTTLSCSYPGKLNISIQSRQKPSFKHPLKMELCENDSLILEVISKDEVLYRWYYLDETNAVSKIIEDSSSFIFITNPGKYWVESYDVLCPDYSDTINVIYIPNDLNIKSVPIVCDTEKEINVEVFPEGGKWHSNKIDSNNILYPQLLQIGQNDFVYEYNASNNCSYMDTLMVLYDPLTQDMLLIDSYEICLEEEIEIQLETFPETTYYLVNYDVHPSVARSKIINSNITIDTAGTFQILFDKHSCSSSSNFFNISYYKDSVFIPNVITYNQDMKNDHFEVYIENANSVDLNIFNRHGDMIYSKTNYDNTWPENELPSGTYYFLCNYKTICRPNTSTAKGWIQLMK